MIENYYMPTTLSDKILTGLLKGEMYFDGVVVTDAIEMAALNTAYPDKEGLFVALLNAGNDIILNVKRLDYIDIIEKAVNDGRISMEHIDDAARCVVDMKAKMGCLIILPRLLRSKRSPRFSLHLLRLLQQFLHLYPCIQSYCPVSGCCCQGAVR